MRRELTLDLSLLESHRAAAIRLPLFFVVWRDCFTFGQSIEQSSVVNRILHKKRSFILLAALLLLSSVQSMAQGFDSFEDDPFGAQESSMPRVRRQSTNSQWRPSSYQDQAAMLEARAKAQIKRNLIYRFETAGLAGTGAHAPLWHTSNRQGLPSVRNNNGYMHFATLGSMLMPNGFGVNYGMDLGLGANLESNWYVHQLYIDLNYKCLGLEVGLKERWGDKNHTLSSGALTWSGNSQPVPEIRAGIPEYVRVPILGKWFSVKGHVGYGRLTDDKWRKEHGKVSYVDGVLFHSKSAFLKFGDEERFPLEVTLGLEMNNLFGGTYHKPSGDSELPSDAAAYWTVLFPFHHVENQGDEDGDNLGSWHLNFRYKLNDWHIGAYYEHFYEDHSSMLGIEYKNNLQAEKEFIFFGFRRNWFDGLFGLEVNAPEGTRFFRNAVVEFMNTRGLSGSICHSACCNSDGMYVIEEVDGRDGMYNHGIYTSYSHWGYAMGNPVLVSPAYNDDGSNAFRSNRVQMVHLGVDGSITDKLDYRMLATTTTHWGQYGAPLTNIEQVTSLMLECSYWLGDSFSWKFSLSGAVDLGGTEMPGNNKGVMLTISKNWKVL